MKLYNLFVTYITENSVSSPILYGTFSDPELAWKATEELAQDLITKELALIMSKDITLNISYTCDKIDFVSLNPDLSGPCLGMREVKFIGEIPSSFQKADINISIIESELNKILNKDI